MAPSGSVVDDAPDGVGEWRWAAASCVGVSHLRTGVGCDDAYFAERICTSSGSSVLLLAVSDGAGSASHSREGARVAVDTFGAILREVLTDRPIHALTEMTAQVIDTVRYQVSLRAMDLDSESRQCACTLVGAVLGEHESFYVQLGDGAIVTRADEPDGQWQPVFWPQQGEYANTTFFVTQVDAGARAESRFEDGPLVDIALFTDGLQALSLNYKDRSAHQPFFDFVARDVLDGRASGCLPEASKRLAVFLSSEQVNARTDDDKTLIVASKRRHRATK